MESELTISGRKIGRSHPPYVIAELSGNHNGDINRALRLIEVAREAGADAVKLQTYTADSLTIDSDRDEFLLKSGSWKGRNLYRLYEEAHTPWEWLPALFEKAREVGITIFSSPFDESAILALEEQACPAYKVASNEMTDWPLVEQIVRTGKPVILSTGAAKRQDVEDTLEFLKELGLRNPAILHCVSAYPASLEEANLRTIDDVAAFPGVIPGFSDHTLGTTAAVAAVARGACIIEKHFTLSRQDGGVDSAFSLEPEELKSLCQEVRNAWNSLGKVQYGGESDLKGKSIFTRQFWTTRDISAGEMLDQTNVKSIRAPANSGGLPTRYYRDIWGQLACRDVAQHTPLQWEMIKPKETT